MTGPPTPTARPIAFIAVGALLLLALAGVAFGALTGGRAAAPSSPSVTATPSASISPTPPVVAGGSAWPAETPTPAPTPTPVPATPTPAPPVEIDAALQVCRDQRDGRCIDEIERMREGPFVVILSFEDSAPGDTFVFRLDGPDDRVVTGGSIQVGGGTGRAWSTFRGGLAEGEWNAVVTLDGAEVARTEFEVR